MVGDLSGEVQLHEAGGEHLRVHAEVVERACCQQLGHLAGNAADAGLQRASAVDVCDRKLGNRGLDRGGWRVGQVQRLAIALHQEVDLVDPQAVLVLAGTERAWEVRADLHDEQSIGVGAGTVQLVDRGAGVKTEADPTVDRRGGRRRHHPRVEVVQHRLEATKVGGYEIHRGTRVSQEALGGAEEAAAVVHAGVHEQLVEIRHQCTEHLQLLEVGALAECVKEAARHTRPERHGQRIDGPNGCYCIAHLAEHAVTVSPARDEVQ